MDRLQEPDLQFAKRPVRCEKEHAEDPGRTERQRPRRTDSTQVFFERAEGVSQGRAGQAAIRLDKTPRDCNAALVARPGSGRNHALQRRPPSAANLGRSIA